MMPERPDLKKDAAAVRARKRVRDRWVEFARTPGCCETLEGSVSYVTGDAIVTGEQGERWPVERAIFLTSYEPVDQLAAGVDGLYQRRALWVLARHLDRETTVVAGHGADLLKGQSGDWLVQHDDGTFSIIASDIFAISYDVVICKS